MTIVTIDDFAFMYFIQSVTFSFDGKFTSYDYLRKYRKIYWEYREEMWEIKKIFLGEFSSNLCQGLYRINPKMYSLPNIKWLKFVKFSIYTVKGEIIAGLNNCVFADIWVFKH